MKQMDHSLVTCALARRITAVKTDYRLLLHCESGDAYTKALNHLSTPSKDWKALNHLLTLFKDGGRVYVNVDARVRLQALDGGFDIPHSDKRFVGFKKEEKQLDAEVHRKYAYGGHVAAYMKTLIEDEPEKYKTHFCEYIKKGIEPEHIEDLYKKVHAAIRADPTVKKSGKEAPKTHKRFNLKKLTYDERKNKLIERLNALNSVAGANDESDKE